jgi:hypothetical protein
MRPAAMFRASETTAASSATAATTVTFAASRVSRCGTVVSVGWMVPYRYS